MKKILPILITTLSLASGAQAVEWNLSPLVPSDDIDQPTAIEHRSIRIGPTIQIAILLDTSNSMDGLIAQAKTKIWSIVNELSDANLNHKHARIQVALMEYGNNDNPKYKGYVRRVSHFTSDLDGVSEKLFSLDTNGGQEYAGRVINDSLKQLRWSNHEDDLKVIIIAGNESFAQGNIDYDYAIGRAIDNNIIVNTIFCGDRHQGINLSWQDGAEIGNGYYLNIDHNQKVIDIPTPYDEELQTLNEKLNKTYLGYGRKGDKMKQRQKQQDENSAAMSPAALSDRIQSKATHHYENESWDLVDASQNGLAVESLAEEALPEPMKKMETAERKAFIAEKTQERADLQAEIKKLAEQRESYIKKNQAEKHENTFSKQLLKAVKSQAEAKGYAF